MHPPYSLDFALSDYYLFLSTVNDFAGEELALRENCYKRLCQFLANRGKGSNERG